MLTVWTGRPIQATGYYLDGHGHCLLLRSGELAPICVYSGAAVIRWRLVRPLPLSPPSCRESGSQPRYDGAMGVVGDEVEEEKP